MVRIAHIINGLEVGGAEGMLVRLVEGMNPHRFQSVVITLGLGGVLRPRLERAGIKTFSLGMRGHLSDCGAVLRCSRLLQQLRPDCVHSWLYHSDLMALAAGRLAGGLRVVWSIRNAGPLGRRLRTRVLALLCAWLSRQPDAIIANSEAGRRAHERIGYCTRRMVVIPNGFDLTRFRSDSEARTVVRAQLGIASDSWLIGLFARFHPVKDHRTFFQAARLLAHELREVHFLVCGRGIGWENPALARMIPDELANKVHLLGEREDMPRLLAALDLATCSSRSEGFPNVLAEAMACGVPCVSTDVGDARLIIGDTGVIVAPGDPVALADAWKRLLALDLVERRRLGEAGRKRIAKHFELSQIVRRYEALYESVVSSQFVGTPAERTLERAAVCARES